MQMIRFNTGAIAACALGASTGLAQDLVPKASPQKAPIILRGATLHTISGDVVVGGDLLFDEGKIVSVGKEQARAEGAEVIDAQGKHVLPGFVLATSTLGLVEVESVDMTIDTSEAGSIKPEVYAAVAVNPDSWWLPVARRNGVLVAGVFPQGGLIPGRVSTMHMDGWTWEDMAIEAHGGLAVNWPSQRPSRFRRFRGGGGDGANAAQEQVDRIDRFFDAAEAYFTAKKADETVPTDLRFEAMSDVLAGEEHVYLSVTTKDQAESAIAWAVERGLKPAVFGGRDAASFVDTLKRHDVPVAITGSNRLPHRRDLSYRSTYELPKLLDDAGVKWCMSMRPRDSANARNLPYEAASAIAHGLSPEAALRAVTLGPAEFLGVADRLGSLEEGKDATLLLCDGDPFELDTKIERAWIAGAETLLADKQTALYEKYKKKYGE